jgi:hypothetical protein
MSNNLYNYNCAILPTVVPAVNRIIAIGDVHGDMKLIIDSLEISNIIKRSNSDRDTISVKLDDKTYNYEWIGKKTVVVQVGDQNDSCRSKNSSCNHVINDTADDIKILNFYTNLNVLAKKDGGAVYSLIGNHEIMNVEGNFSYTSNTNKEIFKDYMDPYTGQKFSNALEARSHAFKPGNEYANFMGCTRQSVLIIGDFMFIHAGVEKEFLQNFRGRHNLQKLNKLVRSWLLNTLSKVDENNYQMNKLLDEATYSPFWTRIMGNLPPHLPYKSNECQQYLAPVLNSYKIKGLVIGHTPQETGINSTCSDKLFRVDVGASKAFHDTEEAVLKRREPQVLEILKLPNGIYKYTVIFQKRETYEAIVNDDESSFGKLESRLPN